MHGGVSEDRDEKDERTNRHTSDAAAGGVVLLHHKQELVTPVRPPHLPTLLQHAALGHVIAHCLGTM